MPGAKETRLCSSDSVNGVSHLAVGNSRGSVQGRVPALVTAGWREERGWRGGGLKREKPPSPGFVSPSWGIRERRRGRGAAGSARGRFYWPRKERYLRTAAAPPVAAHGPPRPFPGLPLPREGGGGGGEPPGICPRGRLRRRTASYRLGEVRAGPPTGTSQVGSDRFGDPAALGCPLQPFLLSPGAPFAPFWQFLHPFTRQQLPFLPLFALCCPQTSPPPCLFESLMKK